MPCSTSRSRHALPALFVAAVTLAAQPASAADAPSREALEFFEQQVRPILAARCQECHGATKEESGLRLDSRVRVFDGGFSGPSVVPGKPDESPLVQAIRRESLEMPPDEPLPDDEIEILVRWVEMGAPWPADASAADDGGRPALGDQKRIFEVARDHWSFQPIVRQQPPKPAAADRVLTPVDAFVLSRLEQEGIAPSPLADRRTLLRRVTIDLTGLPPSEAELAAFEQDTSHDAYAKVVDRLLASPHYGERWGRHWLDVARYADTRDWVVLVDRRYPFAYTYRDWVISAINADMPYDQFLRLQLAADEYVTRDDAPELAALGFLTVGPRYNNDTQLQMADRVDVVVRGLQGLTITCARCHDHKYDPIPTSDYYALYGVFASCQDPAEYPRIAVERSGISADVAEDFQRQHAARQAELDAYGEGLNQEATADFRKRLADYLTSYYDMNIGQTESIRSLLSSRQLKETAMTPLAENLDLARRDKRWQDDAILGPLVELVAAPKGEFAAKLSERLAQAKETDEAKRRAIHPRVLAMLSDSPPADGRELLARYGELFAMVQTAWEAVKAEPVDTAAENNNYLADPELEAIRRVLHAEDGPFVFATPSVVAASRLLGGGRQVLAKFQNAVQELEITHPGAPPRAMTIMDREKPIQPVVFLRGDPSRRGDAVPRRFLTILGGSEDNAFKHGSGRRDLAEAIVARDNPLTARVLVDRVWRNHFGDGLVATAGDFGLRTERPTHSELLDYLAATFIEGGWSLKSLHREIVLSGTYQQSSDIREDAASVDPENRLLWRANRRRLDFESMRDAMLAASGQLDTSIGGRSVSLTDEPFTHRRTVYGFIDRLNLDSMFSTFDFASPDASTPERPETMVPQQALFAMNNPFVVEQARALVAAVESENPTDDAERVARLYGHVFGRAATEEETRLAIEFAGAARPGTPIQSSEWMYGYGSADTDAKPSERFRRLAFWTGSSYQAGPKLPHATLGHALLKAGGGHPGRNAAQATVLRWVAPRDGQLTIGGKLEHSQKPGDGVRGQVLLSRGPTRESLGAWTVHGSAAETAIKTVRVRAGQAIDFVVDCQTNATSDSYRWAPTIEYTDGAKLPGVYTNLPKLKWHAATDFGSPGPPPLSAWEQLAQALFLTNEFMFID